MRNLEQKALFWSEDSEQVYGRISDFETEDEFIAEAKKQNDGPIELKDVKVETCIMSIEGLRPETLIPFSLTDLSIENYYSAEVEHLD